MRQTQKSHLTAFLTLYALLATVTIPVSRGEVMLQWFETEWDEIHRRLPEVAEIGYDYLWVPSPCKAPTGLGTKWGNVGYNLYDRFDLGDIPQRGSLATRYGTRGDLRNMVDKAHQCDVKIIPDIVMNHNGNGPDFRHYPGMKPEDFHVQWEEGHANELDYKRGPRMDQWYHDDGYGGTIWQELVSLIDIRTESDGRFDGPWDPDTPGWNLVTDPAPFIRHPGQYEKYPYGYGAENVRQMLFRWIAWLGNAMDYDGLRLDAGKHVNYEFFGWRGSGFLHEAQYGYDLRRDYAGGETDEADELFSNYLAERDDALIFAEILSGWGEINEYWFQDRTRNPMRFLDYAVKQAANSALNGNIGSFFTSYGSFFHPENGITYVWGHDEGPASKVKLGYAFILTHDGFPMVYCTGKNLTWADHNTKTWMRPGFDSHALGDDSGELTQLVWIHQQFARGGEHQRAADGDFLALERYDPDATLNQGLMVSALNDSGGDIQRQVQTSFDADTILHDYSGHFTEDWGHGLGNIQVDSNGKADIKVPGNSGEGWTCFAPLIPEGLDIAFSQAGSPVPTMTWDVPGGINGSTKTRQVPRITDTNIAVNFTFTPPAGGSVNSCMLKWGQGLDLTANYFDTGRGVVSGQFENMDQVNSTEWDLDIAITDSNIPEGLNVVKCRAFIQRPAGHPALFNTKSRVVYVDRRGPEVDVQFPAEGATLQGEGVMVIDNPDYTAYGMTVTLDGGIPETAHEIMKGKWKFNMDGLSSGTHTALVTTTEADWGSSRAVINTSYYERVFNVAGNTQTIALNHGEGDTKETTFFKTTVTAPGSPDEVRLYWDGYRLPLNGGDYTNVFNGEVIYDADPANVTQDRLWGAFVNGQHFFEAERVDGSVTSRVSRRVVFNLYGINAIDSDGDSIPDNVEMPFIDSNGAPGPDAPWPGDSNRDFVPNYGENWSHLNPYNHSTYYTGQWDDQVDKDGDGYTCAQEVMAGYLQGNVYKYDIYDSGSYPVGPTNVPSEAHWSPPYAVRLQNLRIEYTPNEGPLAGISPVHIHIGHSLKTHGVWQGVTNYPMAPSGGVWVVDYLVPSTATSVDFVFRSAPGTLWDNHNGQDWQAQVNVSTNRYFSLDDVANTGYLVFEKLMPIYAAVKGDNLYVATAATENGANDHFLYVTDKPGPASDPAPGWNKSGQIFMDTSRKPYISAESDDERYHTWNHVSGSLANGTVLLEGEFNLIDAFGYVPEAVYMSAVARETWDSGGIVYLGQSPPAWYDDDTVDVPEFLRVPIASIRDTDRDGYFDVGKPKMWTIVGGDTNDANYGLRRFFVNELAHESHELTVILEPNAGGTNTVHDVELFSNVNRRNFVKLEEDPSTVTTASGSTYYRAYPMALVGPGQYACTLQINKCGAYRINARYKVNASDDYVYYTDGGLRRDCAVVVSPSKALQLTMYELNPMFAEATADDFFGRSTFRDMYLANTDKPDRINTNYFPSLGVNMVWLQPIHPIGTEGRQEDPLTGHDYDPGSPYAVKDYWQVSSVLGDPSTEEQAMKEFTNFVAQYDQVGVGVMLDGTFNHSAWDCEVGLKGVEMGVTNDAAALIRVVRPQWYSMKDNFHKHATHYESASQHDLATAPDRIDFGKWADAADFHFGVYDALVQEGPFDTNNAWSSPWHRRYLREDDHFEGHDDYTREVWEYFAAYPTYWLEKTGHPAGTPKTESYKGIDGLRCDFAQGLPSAFWEYCINRTRKVKWDFIFMAESLDGFTEVDLSKRHGVGYRSARHFDILNENMVFYWRNDFFDYYKEDSPEPYTYFTQQALDARRKAYDASPILLNLTSHDEIYPSHDPWRVFYAHAEMAAVDGVPMLFYGQEAGAQNDFNVYFNGGEITNDYHNFAHYEVNFGKAIPNFKRYNAMTNIWTHRNADLQAAYGRVNRARVDSPALQSQGLYFLNTKGSRGFDPDMFGVAKFEQPGVSAATQDVVFVFVNNNYWGPTYRWQTFDVDDDHNGHNRFGIEDGHTYHLLNLTATNGPAYMWANPTNAADLLASGITVGLTGVPEKGEHVQYLKLVDTAVGYPGPDADGDGIPDFTDPDDDNDGLPDTYEIAHGLDPTEATGDDGWDGDADGDGMSNGAELLAGTDATNATDVLNIDALIIDAGSREAARWLDDPPPPTIEVQWPSKPDITYRLHCVDDLPDAPLDWEALTGARTAVSNRETETITLPAGMSNWFLRVFVE